MKLLILGFAKLKYMPYIHFYLDRMDRTRHDIHILYWNRDTQPEDVSAYEGITLHEFRYYQEDEVSLYKKIPAFLKFRSFAMAIMKREKFEAAIVLTTLPGVLLSDILKKQLQGRYIFDYRDSTYERWAPFRDVVAKLVRNAHATFVSSNAFRRFLPESDSVYTSHNLLTDALSHRDDRRLYGTSSDTVRIAFWGLIRHEEINLQIIRRVAADKRFELHYYGREQRVALRLKAYAAGIGASNVFFHGEYKPEDRYEFARHTDLIHNLYYDPNTMLAMGNKYYDGIIFRIPQLCMQGSFMAERAESDGVGLGADPYSDTFLDTVYDYYRNLDELAFEARCDQTLARIMNEYEQGQAVIGRLCH